MVSDLGNGEGCARVEARSNGKPLYLLHFAVNLKLLYRNKTLKKQPKPK